MSVEVNASRLENFGKNPRCKQRLPGDCAPKRKGTQVFSDACRVVCDARLSVTIACVVILATTIGCAPLRVGTDFDRSASFARLHGFSWMPQEDHGSAGPEAIQQTRDALSAELIRRGFEQVTATDADFFVGFSVDSQDTTEPIEPANEFAWWNLESWWGGQGSRGNPNVRVSRECLLTVEMFDVRMQKVIWHGWMREELMLTDSTCPKRSIRRAVAVALKDFPPQSER